MDPRTTPRSQKSCSQRLHQLHPHWRRLHPPARQSGMLLLDVEPQVLSGGNMLDLVVFSEKQMPAGLLRELTRQVGTLLRRIAKELGLLKTWWSARGAGTKRAAAVGTGTAGGIGPAAYLLGTRAPCYISSERGSRGPTTPVHARHATHYHSHGCMLSAARLHQVADWRTFSLPLT